jgi:selT/selW/selH-like putative selenoprotein
MKSNFLKVKGFLEGQFPELRGKITGENYPMPPILELLQNVMSMLQLAGMAWMVFGGQALFRMLGFSEPPVIYFTIQEYGTQVAIAIFLLIPQLLARFSTTGAFEVVLDGQRVIWSKLEEGRFPSADELTGPLVKLGLAQSS